MHSCTSSLLSAVAMEQLRLSVTAVGPFSILAQDLLKKTKIKYASSMSSLDLVRFHIIQFIDSMLE